MAGGDYVAKGTIEFNEATKTYTVTGFDSSGESRNDTAVQFKLDDTGYVQDYETSPGKSPENDKVFYSNVARYLGDLADSKSIVLLYDSSASDRMRYDIDVQFDLRRPRT